MNLKSETVGFVRGGMLFLEPPHRWCVWQRDVWECCTRRRHGKVRHCPFKEARRAIERREERRFVRRSKTIFIHV
jgi:hypothetical protein